MPRANKTVVELREKLDKIKTEIRQNENRVKELLQKKTIMERNARTRRLIERGAMLESVIVGAAELTNDQIMSLLKIAFNADSVREAAASFLKENAEKSTDNDNGALETIST